MFHHFIDLYVLFFFYVCWFFLKWQFCLFFLFNGIPIAVHSDSAVIFELFWFSFFRWNLRLHWNLLTWIHCGRLQRRMTATNWKTTNSFNMINYKSGWQQQTEKQQTDSNMISYKNGWHYCKMNVCCLFSSWWQHKWWWWWNW